MVIVRPTEVRFGGDKVGSVQSVRVDRHARKVVTEWDDAGPHAVLCDVVQQEARVVVRAVVVGAEGAGLDGVESAWQLGRQGELRVALRPNASDAGQRWVKASRAVLVGVRHELAREGGRSETSAGSGAVGVRELEFVCVGQTGAEDPVEVE